MAMTYKEVQQIFKTDAEMRQMIYYHDKLAKSFYDKLPSVETRYDYPSKWNDDTAYWHPDRGQIYGPPHDVARELESLHLPLDFIVRLKGHEATKLLDDMTRNRNDYHNKARNHKVNWICNE